MGSSKKAGSLDSYVNSFLPHGGAKSGIFLFFHSTLRRSRVSKVCKSQNCCLCPPLAGQTVLDSAKYQYLQDKSHFLLESPWEKLGFSTYEQTPSLSRKNLGVKRSLLHPPILFWGQALQQELALKLSTGFGKSDFALVWNAGAFQLLSGFLTRSWTVGHVGKEVHYSIICWCHTITCNTSSFLSYIPLKDHIPSRHHFHQIQFICFFSCWYQGSFHVLDIISKVPMKMFI